MKTRWGLFLVIVWLLVPLYIFGCSCVGSPTVCGEYKEADVVIVGRVTKILSTSIMYQGATAPDHRIEVAIEKSYKGNEKKSLILSQPNSTCDWQFAEEDQGKQYLFYLKRNPSSKDYTIMVCGRSGEVKQSGDDLSWLNRLPGSKSRTRFSGTVEHFENITPPDDSIPRFTFVDNLSNIPLKVFNDKRSFDVTTNAFGFYEIWGLPAGKYKVEPKIPDLFSIDFSMPSGRIEYRKIGEKIEDFDDFTIEVPHQGCAGIDYIVKKAN